jgi:hypothetical protein
MFTHAAYLFLFAGGQDGMQERSWRGTEGRTFGAFAGGDACLILRAYPRRSAARSSARDSNGLFPWRRSVFA